MVLQKPKLTAEQKRWQAEDDARVLASAQRIAEDPARLRMAKKEAARMASETAKSAQRLVKVAKTPVAKKAAAKKKPKKRAPRKRR